MRHLLSILALACVACGPSEASRAPEGSRAPRVDPPVEAVPTPTPTPTKATPVPGPGATATPAARPARLDEATVAAHRAELAAARALVTRGDLAGAVRAFDALIERTAGSARIYCEAGYVNHRAGDDAKARRLLDKGLARFEQLDTDRPELRRALAMCLYNSGLVHEAQGAPSDAARDYSESLEWRPSPIVQRRWDALPDAIRGERSAATEPDEDGEWEVVADLAAAVAMTERVWCSENRELDDDCRASAGRLVAGEQRDFQLVEISASCCHEMASTWATHLFVVEGGRYRHVAEIATVSDGGGFMSVAGGLANLRAVQLIPGGPSELTFRVEISVIDTEGAYCEGSSVREGLCADVEGALRCRAYDVIDEQTCYESLDDYEGDGEPNEEYSRDVRASIELLGGGRVRVAGELCVPAGEHTIDALFAHDCGLL